MESIFYFPLSLTLQNSIGNGEFSFDANFVSPEFLGEVAEEMDSLDIKPFFFPLSISGERILICYVDKFVE